MLVVLEYEKIFNQAQKISKSQIRHYGPKYGINKFKILSKFYCLVLPQNFGNVVLEVISQKTPVITMLNTHIWKY